MADLFTDLKSDVKHYSEEPSLASQKNEDSDHKSMYGLVFFP